MLAIGAAEDCIGAVGMADPLDVLEYLRCTRPYFVTCRRAVDEDACLKQGKMRLTIITRNIFLNRVWCRRRPPLHQGDLPRAMASTVSSALSPTRWLRACFNRDNDDGNPLLDHSTARNHVDYPTYPAQLAQHWPEGLNLPRPLWTYSASANIFQDFGHQMQVCPP
jgi:hypothetical protein